MVVPIPVADPDRVFKPGTAPRATGRLEGRRNRQAGPIYGRLGEFDTPIDQHVRILATGFLTFAVTVGNNMKCEITVGQYHMT